MDTYEARLATFTDWPADSPVKKEDLARAGQVYTGSGDETKCYVCNKRIIKWEAGDDPSQVHNDFYPDCKLSKQPEEKLIHSMRNVTDDERAGNTRVSKSEKLSVHPDESRDPASHGKQPKKDRTRPRGNLVDHDLAGDIRVAKRPKLSVPQGEPSDPVRGGSSDADALTECSTYKGRLETYQDWPYIDNLLLQNLALAGLLYTGIGDVAKCVICKLKFDKWQSMEDPYNEHKTACPQCDFIQATEHDLQTFHKKLPARQIPDIDKEPTYKSQAYRIPEASEQTKFSHNFRERNRICIKCKVNPREILFVPCSHMVVCQICASEYSVCPVCTCPIIRKSRICSSSNTSSTKSTKSTSSIASE